ncbi:rod shape-determining protein MreD [Sphingomonas floccifaciens]|uniref:Rod shape-determining protein MreD n=1 Tax=Sphingomonas floccifaciens TaxID=1844115 RepID=A0ABW4NFG5_9SPHN
MRPPRPSKFGEPISARRRSLIAAAVVMAGSLLPVLVPLISVVPYLPPLGLLFLLAWRQRSPDILPVWAGAPLGLWDDLLSGHPLGSATSLWTLILIGIDLVDNRLVWRDFWQDWLVAGGAVAGFLIGARLAGTPLVAHVDTVLMIQIAIAAALYPLAAATCGWVDAMGQQRR